MQVLAGTGKGVFIVAEDGPPLKTLESRGVRELVQHGDRIFAGTGAGLFSSDDHGTSWMPSGLPDHEIWQICQAVDGSLYAGTQPAALFRSDDNGATWNEIEGFSNAPGADDWCIPVDPVLPGRARALVIDRENPQRIWVGVEVGGILHSDDGGTSWQAILPGENPDLHMMVAHPQRSGELFASTGYGRLDGVADMVEGNAGVFRSVDGGKSWEYVWKGITPRYSRPMCIDPRPPYGLTVASAPTAFSSFRDADGAQAMLFRSEDSGASWRSLSDAAHTPSRANIHGLTPDQERQGGVIIGTDTGEVWRVGNEADWTLLGDGMPAVLSVLSANGS